MLVCTVGTARTMEPRVLKTNKFADNFFGLFQRMLGCTVGTGRTLDPAF